MKPLNTSALLTFLIALPLAVQAADSSLVQLDLVRTGVDADAKGKIQSQLGVKSSHLLVQLSGLAARTDYKIEVGGVVEGTVTTSKGGTASVRFRTPAGGKDLALDFDPRGQVLRVLQGEVSVLEATLGKAGEPAGSVMVERVDIPLGANMTAAGTATSEYRLDKNGRRRFKVELKGAGAGPFVLYVGGVARGTFTVAGKTAQIKFDTGDDKKALPLDFDPRGQVIDVLAGEVVRFSSELAAQIPNVNTASPRLSLAAITSTGEDEDGTASAKLLIDDRARKHFTVKVRNVPAGIYELLVGGSEVGQITVQGAKGMKKGDTEGSETEGEIEFSAGDDDTDELPLTFDPVGQVLAIQAEGTVYFTSTFNPAAAGAGAGTPSASEPASELEEDLASSGLDADASGKAEYRVDSRGRHRFKVEVEDVPVGSYSLVVGGVSRGVIAVAETADGVQGEVEFTSKTEAGARRLNFDPRGQLLEITGEAGVYFSHFLGAGSASAGGTGGEVVPYDYSLPLISSGEDANATAKAQLKRKISGKTSFEIEAEDLPAGDYDVLVGNVVRGTLTLVADGADTGGQLEFEAGGDDDDDDSAAVLNFDVLDQEIVIRQVETVFFRRVFTP